jgi:hypothetical protein
MREWFSSDFAPTVRPKFVSTEQVILLLFHQVVHYKDLPEDVRKAVDAEMKKRNSSNNATVEDN